MELDKRNYWDTEEDRELSFNPNSSSSQVVRTNHRYSPDSAAAIDRAELAAQAQFEDLLKKRVSPTANESNQNELADDFLYKSATLVMKNPGNVNQDDYSQEDFSQITNQNLAAAKALRSKMHSAQMMNYANNAAKASRAQVDASQVAEQLDAASHALRTKFDSARTINTAEPVAQDEQLQDEQTPTINHINHATQMMRLNPMTHGVKNAKDIIQPQSQSFTEPLKLSDPEYDPIAQQEKFQSRTGELTPRPELLKSHKYPQGSGPAIKVTNFSKKYRGRKNYAVHNISFEVKPGEFHGFIGANGAGKTTTIKSLIGAYAKYEGTVQIFGFTNKTRAAKLKMGYIPEAANFPKTLNTVKYITHMAALAGMKYKDAKRFANRELEAIGLGQLKKAKPMSFSSGQKKKVLLAQALVTDPDVIIMDEPAANLDPKARGEFFETLKKLQQRGKAIFISSHILSELENFVTAVTILDGGKVVYTGSKDELLNTRGMEYRFSFESAVENNKFKSYIEMNKYATKIEGEFLIVQLENRENLDHAMSFIVRERLLVKSIAINRKTLQQAYDEYVRKGSNDTRDNVESEFKKGGK